MLRGIFGYNRGNGAESWRKYLWKRLYCLAKIGSYCIEKCNMGKKCSILGKDEIFIQNFSWPN